MKKITKLLPDETDTWHVVDAINELIAWQNEMVDDEKLQEIINSGLIARLEANTPQEDELPELTSADRDAILKAGEDHAVRFPILAEKESKPSFREAVFMAFTGANKPKTSVGKVYDDAVWEVVDEVIKLAEEYYGKE